MCLPHRDQDPVMILYAHYYLASDLMYSNYKKKVDKNNKDGSLSQDDQVELSIYFCTWIGFLAVTSEGFKKLIVRKLLKEERPDEFEELIHMADDLGRLMNTYKDELRRFRNNVFHLRENTEDFERFIESQPNRLEWAEKLQVSFGEFFSLYRIISQVHYIKNNRKEELIL
ncbi:hypothetical protein [Aliivibrio fischeri]|uniref:hypothetical protein n=1 Tax=Aliivibrio fischeri TaxID=668 RepID=UPI0012DA2027|nr:hypothetical protein [Aliivibrio fischeri]MUJ39697.1 hypothetical protein [Aliivibrio fischeri]